MLSPTIIPLSAVPDCLFASNQTYCGLASGILLSTGSCQFVRRKSRCICAWRSGETSRVWWPPNREACMSQKDRIQVCEAEEIAHQCTAGTPNLQLSRMVSDLVPYIISVQFHIGFIGISNPNKVSESSMDLGSKNRFQLSRMNRIYTFSWVNYWGHTPEDIFQEVLIVYFMMVCSISQSICQTLSLVWHKALSELLIVIRTIKDNPQLCLKASSSHIVYCIILLQRHSHLWFRFLH